jgi:hypothetical protein
MIRKTNGFFGLILLSLLSGGVLSSCDECYQCDVYPNPYVNVKFIKQSELELVEADIEDLIAQLAEERKNEAALTADAPAEQIATIKKAIDSLNAEKVRLEKERNLLQSGMVQIDSLLGDYSTELKIISDSATIHRFPLSMNETSSSFEIYLDGHPNVETLTVNYKTELVVENNRVIIKANSIEDPPISSFDDDSVAYGRDDRKITDETTIYLYY